MSWKKLLPILTFTVFYLSACGTPITATIPPSPTPVRVSYSPYLAGIQDALHACALETQQLAIFFEQMPGAQQDFEGSELIIWWDAKPDEVEFSYQLREDELVVIVHLENPKKELSQSELISLFTGRLERWNEIGTLDQDVKVWIFPETNLLSESFQSGVLNGQRFTRLASLAPSSQAMLESVASEPGAIGFLPRSWLTDDVQAIQVDPQLQISTRKPLLALTPSEPQGAVKELIGCLQRGSGQTILSGYYGLMDVE